MEKVIVGTAEGTTVGVPWLPDGIAQFDLDDGLNVIHLKDGICLASVLMRASDDDDHFVAEARSLSTVLALSAPMTFGDSS
jgi:hypothetical protein